MPHVGSAAMHCATAGNTFQFSGKASTLAALAPVLRNGRVLPMQRISAGQWRNEREAVLAQVLERFADRRLIVRSSCAVEDRDGASGAGMFESVSDVRGAQPLELAIDRVFRSFGRDHDREHGRDEALIQPMAEEVLACGVAMTRDPQSGLPYVVVEYTVGAGTQGVTAGSEPVRSFVALKQSGTQEPAELHGLFDLLAEVQSLTGRDDLDIEFAVTTQGLLLFQVRPMTGCAHAVEAARDTELHATLRWRPRASKSCSGNCARAAPDGRPCWASCRIGTPPR